MKTVGKIGAFHFTWIFRCWKRCAIQQRVGWQFSNYYAYSSVL